jgi:hypothetical protein
MSLPEGLCLAFRDPALTFLRNQLPQDDRTRAMRLFLARLAPGILDRIAYDCGLTEQADKLAAIAEFCLSHGITETDLRVRYPETVPFVR